VQGNPNLLEPILQELITANPQLLVLINQYQDDFFRLLNEPVSGASGGPPSPQYIQVTPEEKAAIDRLEGLGFDRSTVIQAFLACDKDETLAANYLCEHRFDDDEQ
jgi:UV excision repair protein RAD23